jgi:8-hydroxy-5-deazaflavin:NADPH oxidoreductase
MSYAIVGFGKIGQALAHAFARKNIDVAVASRRPPDALAPQARAIGPTVVAKSLRDALEADTIILAVPFGEHREVAKVLPNWKGKTIIDAMNAFPVPEELDGLPSSAFVAKAFTGASLVKGFNHLVAATLAADPIVEGGHRVVFLSPPWPNSSGSHPSSWESSTRVARWCTHAAAPGASSSSRICSRRSSNRSTTIVPGGLLVTSYTTRFTPFTSLMTRVAPRRIRKFCRRPSRRRSSPAAARQRPASM